MTKVCLTMIVGNAEPADVMRRCLESAKPIIGAYCLCFNGDGDKAAQSVAREVLEGIPGQIHDGPWVGFSENRTEAARLASAVAKANGCSHLLMIDCDEEFKPAQGFAWDILDPQADAYSVTVRMGKNERRFVRTLLLRADREWVFVGARDEQPVLIDANGEGVDPLVGIVSHDQLYVQSYGDGMRSFDPDTSEHDWQALEAELANHPDDSTLLYNCAMRALAAKHHDRALELFAKRSVDGTGFDQQQWHAAFYVALLKSMYGYPLTEVDMSFFTAFMLRPQRAESLFYWMVEAYKAQRHGLVNFLGSVWQRIPMPNDALFVEPAAYWVPPKVRIGVISAPRANNDMHPLPVTLMSALTTDSLTAPELFRVFYDAVEAPPCAVAIEPATQAQLNLVAEGGRYGTLNLIRALRWAADQSEIVMTCEDDILFSREWFRRAMGLLGEAEGRSDGMPVIISMHDMFSPHDFPLVHRYSGIEAAGDRLWDVTYDTTPNGSQFYCMRPGTAKHLADMLDAGMRLPTAEERARWAMDVGVLRACRHGVARLMFTEVNRVLHMAGIESTWASKDARFPTDAAHKPYRTTKRFSPI